MTNENLSKAGDPVLDSEAWQVNSQPQANKELSDDQIASVAGGNQSTLGSTLGSRHHYGTGILPKSSTVGGMTAG